MFGIEHLKNAFHIGANTIRGAILTPKQVQARENAKASLEMVRLATLIAVLVATLFFAIFPSVLSLCLLGLTGLGAWEVITAINNILEILNKAAVELLARSSKEDLIAQVSQNTIFVRSAIRIVNPDLTPFLFKTS